MTREEVVAALLKPPAVPNQQLAMDFTKRGRPEIGGAEMDRAAGMGVSARGGATPVPSYTDKSGYRVEVRPKREGEVLRSPGENDVEAYGNNPARMGDINIVHPNGQRALRGYWMDWHEPGHGVSKDVYKTLSPYDRAALEARLQGTGYAPLEQQFNSLLKKPTGISPEQRAAYEAIVKEFEAK